MFKWKRSCQGSRGMEGGTVAVWGAGGAGGAVKAAEAGGGAGTLGGTSRASSSRLSAC